MSESIDDLTVEYEENGQIILKELDKIVLSKGAWTTILFRYQEWKPQTSSYGPDKYVIRRYKKMGGEYRQQSKFTISSADQARKIVDALQTWIGEAEQELLESKRRGHALFLVGSKRLHVNFEIPAYKFAYMGKAGGR